jgi:hypothetical protein
LQGIAVVSLDITHHGGRAQATRCGRKLAPRDCASFAH